MKKYLLIPLFFIAALATANAGCGDCGSSAEKKCDKESAKECCPGEKKCCSEDSKSCCAEEESEHTHE